LERLRAGEYGLAEAHFARAYKWAPDRPEICCALGRERLRRGDYAEAEELLRRAWERDPSLVSAAATLARCAGVHRGRHADAHDVLDDAEAHHGPLAVLAVVRSELYLDEGRIDDAKNAAESALADCDEASSEFYAARAALARVYNHEGIDLSDDDEHHQAVFAFKRASDLDPAWSSPHVNMGAAFLAMKNRTSAHRAFDRAVSIDPSNPIAHYNLGLVLQRAGDKVSAAEAFERAIDLDEGNPDPWVHLGAIFVADGDRDSAEASFRRALEIEPNHARACRYLADLLVRDSRYLEAAVFVDRLTGKGS
jgi:tetratricopeptide (TPR) repeat protein